MDFVFSKAKKRKYLCVSWVDTKPYVLFTSLSFHPVNTYLTYHCICEYIILFAFHAQFTWYPGTWLHGHTWQKKQHPESKWSVYTLDGNDKSNNAAQKMNEYIFTKLANANNSSNTQMLRNVHKCKRVCLVCYDTLMMLLFLSKCGSLEVLQEK